MEHVKGVLGFVTSKVTRPQEGMSFNVGAQFREVQSQLLKFLDDVPQGERHFLGRVTFFVNPSETSTFNAFK